MIAALLMFVGAVFALIASIGLHRFDDVFARIHAAGKASTFGFGLILLGAAIRLDTVEFAAKLAFIGLMAIITIPAGVHIIARAAWRAGSELSDNTVLDEASAARQAETRRPDRR